MPHQTRLVELLIASPEVGIIIFSPKPLKVTNSSNKDLDYSPSPPLSFTQCELDRYIRESAAIVLSFLLRLRAGMGGDMVHNLTLPESYSKITMFLTDRGFVVFPTAHSCKRLPSNETKMLRRLAEQLFSQARKHSSLFSPSVCRYA